MERPKVLIACVGVICILLGWGCTLFENEQVAKGRKLFGHYCVQCHGESGIGNGYNSSHLDPRPRNLTDSQEEFMTTLSDEEVFNVFSRDMISFEEFEEEFEDEEDFDDMLYVPSNMPTFKNTLSVKDRWALVAFVRTLHGMKANIDLVALRKEREAKVQEVQAEFEEAQKTYEVAEEKASAAQEAIEDALTDEELEDYEPEEVTLPEEEVFTKASEKFELAKAELEIFSKRPRKQIARPELASTPEELEPLIEEGKILYSDKYGCDSCHAIGGVGGVVGPELDRAGFRMNATWIYQWIRSPQAMKRKTRMPNLGLTDEHARAITAYLGTLRAAPPSAESGMPQAAVE